MKKIYIILIPFVFLLTASGYSQTSKEAKKTDGFSITGNITGLANADVFLMHKKNDVRVTDTVKVQDNKFIYTGKTDEPSMYYLDIKHGETRERIEIFVENAGIIISGRLDSLDRIQISGSKVHDEYVQYEKILSAYTLKLDSISTLYDAREKAQDEKAIAELDKAYEEMEQQKNAAVKKYIASHPASYVSAYAAAANFTIQPELESLQTVYGYLDADRKKTQYGKVLSDAIGAAKRTAIGMVAPDFSLKDTSDRVIALSSMRGKITLLDFWASWCGPCRKENPNIVKAYNTFHERGLEIFAVSLDKDAEKWKKAIVKDGLTWTQVSDLKYWNSEAASLYGVRSIPANFLLDKDGKIIARNLHGDELEKKLMEVLAK